MSVSCVLRAILAVRMALAYRRESSRRNTSRLDLGGRERHLSRR